MQRKRCSNPICERYTIEADIRGKDHATRLTAHAERAALIRARLDDWLRQISFAGFAEFGVDCRHALK
jgi:hypothetical protein